MDGLCYFFFTAILSGAGLGLNRRELIREDIPGVQNLETQSNLVPALQVTLTVRVAETDDLKRQGPLNPPANAVDEVDSILIDEARTPLIISGEGDQSTDLYDAPLPC